MVPDMSSSMGRSCVLMGVMVADPNQVASLGKDGTPRVQSPELRLLDALWNPKMSS